MANTQIYTYFTTPGNTDLLYATNETDWQLIRLRLETAGPVAIGTAQEITPVGSGRGTLLPTGLTVDVELPPSSRLYIAADAVNRVAIQIEHNPWLRQILEAETRVAQNVAPTGTVAPATSTGGNQPVPIGRFGFQDRVLPPSYRPPKK